MISKLRLPALGLLWIFVLVSCAHQRSQDPTLHYSGEKLSEIGQKYLAAGELGLAIKYLMAAEDKRPNDPNIHYYLGVAYDQRGLPDKAVEHYQRAIELKPDYSEAYNSLGAHYAENNNLQKAEEAFKKAAANPAYATPFYAFYNLGKVYEKRGLQQEALKQYQQAIRLQPNYGMAYYRMGMVLESMQRLDEARDAFGNAISYNPNIVEAQFRYGVLCYNAGDIEQSLSSLSRVIKVSPYSTMGSEARNYMDRMQGVVGGSGSRGATGGRGERASSFEVVSDRETARGASSGGAASVGGSAKGYESAGGLSSGAAMMAETVPSAAGQKEPGRGESSDGSSSYVVQVGTFRDRANAERVQERMRAMGYDAVIKTFPHQTLGSMYSVQIRQIDEIAVANTIVAEIEKAERLKPVILRVRGNS
jgi:tetratricopeptide (TPR) repeat protein